MCLHGSKNVMVFQLALVLSKHRLVGTSDIVRCTCQTLGLRASQPRLSGPRYKECHHATQPLAFRWYSMCRPKSLQ